MRDSRDEPMPFSQNQDWPYSDTPALPEPEQYSVATSHTARLQAQIDLRRRQGTSQPMVTPPALPDQTNPPALPRISSHAVVEKLFVPKEPPITRLRSFTQKVTASNWVSFKSGLTLVATLTGLYLIFGPLLPGLLRKSASILDKNKSVAQADTNGDSLTPINEAPADLGIVRVGQLVIEKIGVNSPIVEGRNDLAMSYGVWHRNNTGTPSAGSNTVLSGHRYEYVNGPRTLYSLDKVSKGDIIEVRWGDKSYRYSVFNTFVVPADAIQIEAATKESILTIYTCTPLWTSKDRLVVQAKPLP